MLESPSAALVFIGGVIATPPLMIIKLAMPRQDPPPTRKARSRIIAAGVLGLAIFTTGLVTGVISIFTPS